MKNYIKVVIIGIACISITCKDKSSSLSTSSSSVNYSSSECVGSGLGKSINKVVTDSIFTYSFNSNTLDIVFSVISFCGRDKNVFVVQHTSNSDTIDIAVTDTCQSQPRCTCVYMITVSNIPVIQDRYVVRCVLYRPSPIYVAHLVEVHR